MVLHALRRSGRDGRREYARTAPAPTRSTPRLTRGARRQGASPGCPGRSAKRCAALPSRTAISMCPLDPTSDERLARRHLRVRAASPAGRRCRTPTPAAADEHVAGRLVMALPNRSISSTSPCETPVGLPAGAGQSRQTGSRKRSPNCSMGIPVVSAAAAGANTSRPWKTGDASWRHLHGDDVRASRSAAAVDRTPLSGATQEPVIGGHGERRARRAHTGVDHDEVDGTGRKPVPVAVDDEARVGHVLRRDLVRDVHERRGRRVRQDDALHLRDVSVCRAEVGEQRDDRTHGAFIRRSTRAGKRALGT